MPDGQRAGRGTDLSLADIRRLLGNKKHRLAFEKALEDIQVGEAAIARLDDFKISARAKHTTLAEAVLGFLLTEGKVGALEAAMLKRSVRARAAEVTPVVPSLAESPVIGAPGRLERANYVGLESFIPRANAFACRIRVDNANQGSGLLVSPRLVATAWHVVATEKHKAVKGQVSVRASDGKIYPASVVYQSECHKREWDGQIPTAREARTRSDIALLRLGKPLGYQYGHIEFSQSACELSERVGLLLVHFPEGVDQGTTFASVWRNRRNSTRYPHDAPTNPGSSGGGGFNNAYELIGLHQGKWGSGGRLVPCTRYIDDPKFKRLITEDLAPNYLWSIDGTLKGEMIIGRSDFQEALNEMVENKTTRLKMIWVRRIDPELPVSGLFFSQKILEAFLTFRGHRPPFVVTPSLETTDLLEDVRTTVLGSAGGSLTAKSGVRKGETANASAQGERAAALMRLLGRVAEERGKPVWLFVCPAPAGISPDVQVQFEQLVGAAMKQDQVKIVLAGYETYRPPGARFASLHLVQSGRASGFLTDDVGRFEAADVAFTLGEMYRSYDIEPRSGELLEVAEQLLSVSKLDGPYYPASELKRVGIAVSAHVKKMIGVRKPR